MLAGRTVDSLRKQTYFRLCDVENLSQSQLSLNSPRTTARGIRCKDLSSFILSWNLIGQRETKVVTSRKSFPCSGSQTLFSTETSDSRKYVYFRRLYRLYSTVEYDPLNWPITARVITGWYNNLFYTVWTSLDKDSSVLLLPEGAYPLHKLCLFTDVSLPYDKWRRFAQSISSMKSIILILKSIITDYSQRIPLLYPSY